MGNSNFGISIPKGHIEVLEAAAENLVHVGHSADRAGQAMRKAAKVDGWEGSASAAFTQTILDSTKPADIAEKELPRAAKALRELADDLRTARRVTREAVERARLADHRREVAERDAKAAQTKVTNHNAEATALEGVIQGAAGRGDPATASREAQRDAKRAGEQAQDALADAKRRIQKAIQDLEEAQRDGRVANERYDQACQQAAKALQAVAAAAPGAGKDDGRLTWDDVYDFLRGKPGEKALPALALGLGLLKVAAAKRWFKVAGKAEYWKTINPATKAAMLKTAWPTLNNSPIFRGVAGLAGKIPQLSRAAGWVTDIARNPLMKKAGLLGSAFSLADDVRRLASPDENTAAFVSDIAKTGFDVSATAFLIAPNPVTAGAVLVTGAIWAGTEVWQHYGDEIGDAIDSGIDTAKDIASDIGDGAKDLVSDIGGGLKSVFG